MPHAAARRHPSIWVENPKRTVRPQPIGETGDADTSEHPPAHPDRGGGKQGVHPGLDLAARRRAERRDERHQRKGREGGERD